MAAPFLLPVLTTALSKRLSRHLLSLRCSGTCLPAYAKAVADTESSFTNVVGQLLEARLWDIQRFKDRDAHPEKHAGISDTATTAPGESIATVTVYTMRFRGYDRAARSDAAS